MSSQLRVSRTLLALAVGIGLSSGAALAQDKASANVQLPDQVATGEEDAAAPAAAARSIAARSAAPTREQLIEQLLEMTKESSEGLTSETRADGARVLDLEGTYMSVAIATPATNGGYVLGVCDRRVRGRACEARARRGSRQGAQDTAPGDEAAARTGGEVSHAHLHLQRGRCCDLGAGGRLFGVRPRPDHHHQQQRTRSRFQRSDTGGAGRRQPRRDQGQQRLNVFEYAANIWEAGAAAEGRTSSSRRSSCRSAPNVLGSAGATFIFSDFPGAEVREYLVPLGAAESPRRRGSGAGLRGHHRQLLHATSRSTSGSTTTKACWSTCCRWCCTSWGTAWASPNCVNEATGTLAADWATSTRSTRSTSPPARSGTQMTTPSVRLRRSTSARSRGTA